MGLCNGPPGEVYDILYAANSRPPDLPVAILVDPTRPHCVPIAPRLFERESNGNRLSRLQVPLRLRYAMTIHKSQGQTLPKVVIDLGKSENAPLLLHLVSAPWTMRFSSPWVWRDSSQNPSAKASHAGRRSTSPLDCTGDAKKVGQQNSGKEASTASDDHQESPNPDQGRWDTVCEHLLTLRIQNVTQIVQAEKATI